MIVAINGQSVESVSQLMAYPDDFKPGDTAGVTVLRKGRNTTLQITLTSDG